MMGIDWVSIEMLAGIIVLSALKRNEMKKW